MGIYAFRLFRVVVFACLATLHSGCVEQHEAIEPDAQVIVIGAGLSGLSAAVELGRRGIDVLVVDMNSVAGGHTMLAGGVAMAATQLQEELGIEDSAEQAYRDWMDWTEDGDARWTRYYAENSREMIYDWVTEMGVEFVRIAPSHGNSVARFHFTKGRAAHLVLPIYRTALGMPNISYLWNSRAEELLLEDGRVTGVVVKELRSGEVRSLRAGNVVLATGGFETDVERVLANWISDLPRPDRLLIGAAISATGSGHDMATAAGAALDKINRHFIYVNGVIDPRDPQQSHALTAGNEGSMWVNASGQRFTNEAGFEKDILVDLVQQEPATYWMVFDETMRESFGVRGAAWLKTPSEKHPILDNPQATKRAQSLEKLAAMAGLPGEALVQSVREYNDMISAGEDTVFGRFSLGDELPPKIQQAPFYAVQMFPVTRKNMGGVAIDGQLRALDKSGQVLPGLYAVGELNGSLGINGKYGLDGMFLGPAILSGRLAAMSIAAEVPGDKKAAAERPTVTSRDDGEWQAAMTRDDLEAMLSLPRDGYWHFQVSHELVLEREYPCSACHSAQLPFSTVNDRANRLLQTTICTTCH
jgi:succinate dehydrogenase/fumarate reductase flavoprotein subunit